MALRVCAEAGCPTLVERGRCDEHRRKQEQRRGSSHARGYGRAHQAERERWVPLVSTGSVTCARCHEPIEPDTPWDLGHDDDDRTKYAGPEHAACNRATSGRRNN